MKKIKSILLVTLMISYCFFTVTYLFRSTVNAEIWNIETVDQEGYNGSESIALDSNGFAHISYYDGINKDLKYARWTGGSWDIQTIDTDGDVGRYTSIALDSNDYAHISYYNHSNYDLKYARWTGSSWDIQTVDMGNVGYYTSIALDSNDYPHISYAIIGFDGLKYAKWTGSSWDIQTVDSGEGGYCTSIALDNSDFAHISYYNSTDKCLKYAKWTGSSWDIETVDSAGDVGWDTSIALDSNEYPHISYRDLSNNDLKYAKWSGSAWDIQTIDSVGWVGRDTSIALSSSDYPHISYWDWSNNDLKYVKWNGSAWDIQIVDSVGDVGAHTSIALDSSGYAHICYYDNTNKDLKYARAEASTTPSAPYELYVIMDDNQIILTWNTPLSDGGSPILKYNIYRNGTVGIFASVSANQLWFNDTHFIKGLIYTYNVSAVNIIGEGSNSTDIYITPMTEPSAPQNIQTNIGDSFVNISWTVPFDSGGSVITGYNIYRNDITGVHASVLASQLWYNDTNTVNGVTYTYNISASNCVGEGSNSTLSVTPMTKPSAPQNLQANAGDGYVNLTWGVPISNGGSAITNYKIYRGKTSGGETYLSMISNVLYYNDTGPVNGEAYFYYISAINVVGEGPLSNEIYAIPIDEITDSDQDDLPDRWELDQFGNLSYDAQDDPDDDGYTNLQEYHKNTKPNDPADYPLSEPSNQEISILGYWWVILTILIILIVIFILIFFKKRKSLQTREEISLASPSFPPER